LRAAYTERAPAFADDLDAVIFLAEGLLFRETPWSRDINPERLSLALRQAGISASLHALGTRDSIRLVKQIAALDEAIGIRALEVLDELEFAWATETNFHPRAGLRELVLHLVSSGKRVLFVSGLSEKVARLVVPSSLKTRGSSPVFARRSWGSTEEVIDAALRDAVTSLGAGAKYAVVAHANAVEYLPPNPGPVLLVVGQNRHELGSSATDVIDLAAECALTAAERTDVDKRISMRDRVRKLRSTGQMTNEEMVEYVDLTGGVRLLGNSGRYGYVDEKIGQQNVQLMRHIRNTAADNQHLLEVVSIDAALIEVQLRNWLTIHRDESFDPYVRMTFGQTIDRAAAQGFPGFLVERLRTFNSMRNDSVHALARGVKSYHAMTDDYMSDCVLLFDVEDFVLESAPVIGRVSEDY
jgi:hypothetical protein